MKGITQKQRDFVMKEYLKRFEQVKNLAWDAENQSRSRAAGIVRTADGIPELEAQLEEMKGTLEGIDRILKSLGYPSLHYSLHPRIGSPGKGSPSGDKINSMVRSFQSELLEYDRNFRREIMLKPWNNANDLLNHVLQGLNLFASACEDFMNRENNESLKEA